ncbi:MAG: cyclophilin-like fold protein [Petrimonas sp.]|nr:cyclophilin-like fold protein [Petrimonas sp.]
MKHLFLVMILFVSTVCNAAFSDKDNDVVYFGNNTTNKGDNEMETNKIKIKVGSQTFTATLADNQTSKVFQEMLPMTIKMTDLHRNEKYYDLPESLPTNSSNPRTIQNGDLMLYGSRTVVLFYKTFSTSYSYTRIGKIDNPAGLASALGSGSVTVTIEAE